MLKHTTIARQHLNAEPEEEREFDCPSTYAISFWMQSKATVVAAAFWDSHARRNTSKYCNDKTTNQDGNRTLPDEGRLKLSKSTTYFGGVLFLRVRFDLICASSICEEINDSIRQMGALVLTYRFVA